MRRFFFCLPLLMVGCGTSEPGARDDLIDEPVDVQASNALRDDISLLLSGGPDAAGIEDLPGFMENLDGYSAEEFGAGNAETFNQIKALAAEANKLYEGGDSAGAKDKMKEALQLAQKLPGGGGGDGGEEAAEE